jgi:hypothetical protein
MSYLTVVPPLNGFGAFCLSASDTGTPSMPVSSLKYSIDIQVHPGFT